MCSGTTWMLQKGTNQVYNHLSTMTSLKSNESRGIHGPKPAWEFEKFKTSKNDLTSKSEPDQESWTRTDKLGLIRPNRTRSSLTLKFQLNEESWSLVNNFFKSRSDSDQSVDPCWDQGPYGLDWSGHWQWLTVAEVE